MSIHKLDAQLENGEYYSLSKYKGKVLIIVNTATKCGLASQFSVLEELYQMYQPQGLEILGFPSNQFKQEISSGAGEACRTSYGVTFPIHAVSKVNGPEANPIFHYLEDHTVGFLGSKIKWNFTKFLIDRDGKVVKRYAPKDNPRKMIDDIERLLAQS